jgi:hypothetical protein
VGKWDYGGFTSASLAWIGRLRRRTSGLWMEDSVGAVCSVHWAPLFTSLLSTWELERFDDGPLVRGEAVSRQPAFRDAGWVV